MSELTRYPTLVTPRYDLSPWTVDLLVDGYDSRCPGGPHEMPARCEACGARSEELLFFGHGDWQCGACAASCEHCDKRAAVVSARRSSAPSQIDHVCVECLVEHWEPAEILSGSWFCEFCDQWHVGEWCPLAYECDLCGETHPPSDGCADAVDVALAGTSGGVCDGCAARLPEHVREWASDLDRRCSTGRDRERRRQ